MVRAEISLYASLKGLMYEVSKYKEGPKEISTLEHFYLSLWFNGSLKFEQQIWLTLRSDFNILQIELWQVDEHILATPTITISLWEYIVRFDGLTMTNTLGLLKNIIHAARDKHLIMWKDAKSTILWLQKRIWVVLLVLVNCVVGL